MTTSRLRTPDEWASPLERWAFDELTQIQKRESRYCAEYYSEILARAPIELCLRHDEWMLFKGKEIGPELLSNAEDRAKAEQLIGKPPADKLRGRRIGRKFFRTPR